MSIELLIEHGAVVGRRSESFDLCGIRNRCDAVDLDKARKCLGDFECRDFDGVDDDFKSEDLDDVVKSLVRPVAGRT